MVKRVPVVPQDVASVTAMRISDNPGAPMTRRHMSDGQFAVAVAVPPIQFDDIVESEVRNQVENVVRNHDGRWRSAAISSVLDNRPQRWPVQVVEMGMGN